MANLMAYREGSWLKSRTFELTSETVTVRNWGFAGRLPEAEITIRLRDLSPDLAGRSWAKRDEQHTVLFGVVALASLAGVVWLAVTAGGRNPAWLSILPAMIAALFLAASIAVFDPRRVEYVMFNNRASQVILSVGRIGARAGEFDAFVAAIQRAAADAAAMPVSSQAPDNDEKVRR